MQGWEDEAHTSSVVQWFMDNELCGIAMESGSICGVACVRFLQQAEDGLIPYRHEPKGDWTWVELVVADKGVAICSLFNLLWDRYGRRPFVAYRRGNKNGKIRTYTLDMFERMNRYCSRNLTLVTNASGIT
jgi:hypothetical protein